MKKKSSYIGVLISYLLLSTGCGTPPQATGESCDTSRLIPLISRYKGGLEGLRIVTIWPDQTTVSTFLSTSTLYQEIETVEPVEADQPPGVERTVQTEKYRYEEMPAIGGGTQVKVSLDQLPPVETVEFYLGVISNSCISSSIDEGEIKYKVARKRESRLPSRSGDEIGEISVVPLPANSSAPWSLGASATICRASDLTADTHAGLPVCAEGLPFDHN
jgi:hypothetical protein